jgi:hypothetical protein
VNATGGAAVNATGGAMNATGGAVNATGGAVNATGGAVNATGGAVNATGGAVSATGGMTGIGGGSPEGAAGGGASTSTATCPVRTPNQQGNYEYAVTAANNYTFWGEVQLGSMQSVKSKTDLTFNWSTLNRDMCGLSMDPQANVGNIAMLLFHLTKEQLQTKIDNDSLDVRDRIALSTYLTGGTQTQASTVGFDLLGQPLNHDILLGYLDGATYPPSEYTYLVVLGSGTEYGRHLRALGVFNVETNASSTEVTIGPGSASCDFQANLEQLVPLPVPMNTNRLAFDWSGLTKSAAGRFVDYYLVGKASLAEFNEPVAELQTKENFAQLEKLAVNTWSTFDVMGTNVALSTLQNDKDGSAFRGIDSSHTWLFFLQNTDSLNPAPWFITVLKACQ